MRVIKWEPFRDIDDAFDRLRMLAGAPNIPTPGQELLDTLIAASMSPATHPMP